MIYIVTALIWEARAFIDNYDLKLDNSLPYFQVYSGEDIKLVVSGVGKMNSAIATAYVLSQPENMNKISAVNIGLCGSRDKEIKIGEPLLINKIVDKDTAYEYYPDILFSHHFKESGIVTHNRVVYGGDGLNINEKCVDMEISGFYSAAAHFLAPHRIYGIKVVSDYMGQNSNKIDRHFIVKLMEECFTQIDNFLESIQKHMAKREDVLTKKDLSCLDSLKNRFGFTTAQFFQLKDMAFKYKIRNRKDLPDLNNICAENIRTKDDVKKAFEKVKAVLLS